MNANTLQLVGKELAAELTGRRVGRIFQIGRSELAFDLRLTGSQYLYVNFGPAEPSVYLIVRRLKDLERMSGNLLPFALSLRKRISNAEVTAVGAEPGERVLRIRLAAEDEFGSAGAFELVLQLTGRSANVFLTDGGGAILDRARDTLGPGQQVGERYSPPDRPAPAAERASAADRTAAASPHAPSGALDAFYSEQSADRKFLALARAASGRIEAAIRKRERLIANLRNDLTLHGDADEWKRTGDLLLSNVSTARREGARIYVTDYFSESLPEIAIDADENDSITETAEKYFRRYTKARNAAAEIAGRIEKLTAELEDLAKRKTEVANAIEARDAAYLESVSGNKAPPGARNKKKLADTGGIARRFVSSDGFEILVGKRAGDNDLLTFRIAKSLDTWMHAADYPGSHVVIRNPNRSEIPQRTLHEAARLAAFYSQGKAQVKAAVHYTQKKFVNKPKGAAPGLVSLASFKTLLVEPGVPEGTRAL